MCPIDTEGQTVAGFSERLRVGWSKGGAGGVGWSMASKAALRSSRTRMLREPERPVTSRRAVSVCVKILKPGIESTNAEDWRPGRFLSCEEAACSNLKF